MCYFLYLFGDIPSYKKELAVSIEPKDTEKIKILRSKKYTLDGLNDTVI